MSFFREWRTFIYEAVIIVSISSYVSFPKRIHAIFCITLRNFETNFFSPVSCLAVCRLLLFILCYHNAILAIEKCFKILSLQCKSCELEKKTPEGYDSIGIDLQNRKRKNNRGEWQQFRDLKYVEILSIFEFYLIASTSETECRMLAQLCANARSLYHLLFMCALPSTKYTLRKNCTHCACISFGWLGKKKKRKKKYVFRHREKNGKKVFFGVRWCDEFWCFDMLKESVMLAGNANILYYRRSNTRSVAVLCSFNHCNCDMRWCFYWNRVRVGRYPFLSHNLDSRFVSQQPKRELVFVLDWVAFFSMFAIFSVHKHEWFFSFIQNERKKNRRNNRRLQFFLPLQIVCMCCRRRRRHRCGAVQFLCEHFSVYFQQS